MSNPPASRTAGGGAGIRTENSLTGEAVPELLESRDKESVTFGHLNDSRSREFEGEGETQDSGCCSPYTLDLHVIKHPPQTANLRLDTNTQRPSRKPWRPGAYFAQTPNGCTIGLPVCSRGFKHSNTQRPTQGAVTHMEITQTHRRHTPGTHSLNLQVETAGAWNCCAPAPAVDKALV